VTVAEQYAGILKMIRRGEWKESRLEQFERDLKRILVIPWDVEICRIYGDLKASLKTATGTDRVVPVNDLWIAACAKRYSLTLVTHNRKHFCDIPGVEIISESVW
jgi:tRNA(fMet)-specific endonuclease VapC